MKTIRASEIGAFLYCKRAWGYQRQGIQTENLDEVAGGIEIHQRHEKAIIASSCLQTAAAIFLLIAFAILAIYIVGQIV